MFNGGTQVFVKIYWLVRHGRGDLKRFKRNVCRQ